MKQSLKPFFGILLIAAVVAGFILVPKVLRANEVAPWTSDYAAAKQQAAAQHKLVLLYFTATWCGPCQEMKHTTFADREVERAVTAKLVPVKLDVDENRPLAQQFGIESIPNFKIIDGEGRVLKEQAGYMTSAEFLAWIK